MPGRVSAARSHLEFYGALLKEWLPHGDGVGNILTWPLWVVALVCGLRLPQPCLRGDRHCQLEDEDIAKEGGENSMAETLVREVQPRAQSALANSPIYELRELLVQRHGDGLLLSGTVSSFYHKQLAQEVVRTVCDNIDIDVVNSIRVR